jgi:imidazolonepropionase-like amidohydrolase
MNFHAWSIGLGTLLLVSSAPLAATENDHPFELDTLRKPALQTGGNCVIRNVIIHSGVAPETRGDVLVQNGRIAAIGKVDAPSGCLEIDGSGKHLAPGVIDCHSHMAVDGSVNEGTLSITCDVDISDVVNADDLTIYRALAGGVTTARLLHGSANAIGGRHEVIKLKWHKTASELRFQGAPEGVKFALGENPKQSNGGGGGGGGRFPDTRMGVEAIFYRAFSRAREYQREWSDYRAAVKRGEDPTPPRRDVRLDALSGILDGSVQVHSHCYRADEILMLLRTAETYGFRVKTLQHVLEGYKVAREIAAHGAGGSTFGDWWAYKIEAYDAIPQNAALMDQAGVVASVNSDSDEMVRRLYGEAAKSVRYAGMDPVRALALVTINPARQLGIDKRTGSIETGKDADLVLLTGDPLSSLARVEWTMVDGELQFQRRDAFELDSRPPPVPALVEPATGEAAPEFKPDGGETVAITGGTLHPITTPDIPNGTLLLQGGRIVAMGTDLAIPAGARIVDATNRHVWPGIIALDTPLGLFEIGSVRGTDDLSEIGGNQPDIRASAALSAESAHIPVTRFNGITRSQSAPQGGGPLMGQSCVIRLSGDTWEELLMIDRDMLHVDFPSTGNTAKEKKEGEPVKELRRLFKEAREYSRLSEESQTDGVPPPPFDARLAALAPYAKGEKKIALHADNAQTILFAMKFAKEEKLDAILFGAREGWKVADAIAREKLPVVVGPVLSLPSGDFDPYDAPYSNAAVLARAGVPFAIMSADGENPRNVAFHAAMASAFGLPHEEALRSITFYAARMLGLEKQLGSLAPGKIADVIVTDGDLLEIRSQVREVFIDGKQQPMRNRQTDFYDRYKARIERGGKK